MTIGANAEKANIQIKDVAVAMMPERGRAPKMDAKLLELSELVKKGKGESVFKAAVAEKDDDMYVNFTEMRNMVDGEKDPKKTEDNQSDRWKRLNLKLGIYDKWLNNNLEKVSDEEGADIRNVLVDIPGFCESIAVATGGKLTFDQVKNYLTGKGSTGVGVDEQKTIAAILGRFVGDGELRRRMEKSLSTLSSVIPEDDLTTAHEISTLKDKVKGKDALLLRRKALEDSQEKFKNLSPDERQKAEDLNTRVNDFKQAIDKKYQPALLSEPAIDSVLSQVRTQLTTVKDDITKLEGSRFHKEQIEVLDRNGNSFNPQRFRDNFVKDAEVSQMYIDKIKEQSELSKTSTQLESLKSIYADPHQKNLLESYNSFEHAKISLTEVNDDLTKISDSERQLVEKEGKRNKYADKYKRKLERTMGEEIKKFWNEVKLADAQKASEAEAAKKAEEKATRNEKARLLLDRYMKMSFLKYNKEGKVVGWRDKALKDFVKKDMLSQSPAQLTRSLLERIDDESSNMPPKFEEEMRVVLKDMGVGKGEPPLSYSKMLDSISDDDYYKMSTEKVPEMMGYALGRGYYFDRLRLSKPQTEFIRQAYPAEFFTKAIEARDEEFKQAEKMLKSGLLTGGAMTEAKLKEIIGKDWVQGSSRLMKTLAVAGAIGAGAFALTGGLAVPDLTGVTPFAFFGPPGADTGVARSLGTLKTAYNSVLQTGALASRASGDLIAGTAGGVQKVAVDISKLIP